VRWVDTVVGLRTRDAAASVASGTVGTGRRVRAQGSDAQDGRDGPASAAKSGRTYRFEPRNVPRPVEARALERYPARPASGGRAEETIAMTKRIDEILSWYGSDNPGVLKNLRWMLETGRLGGSGKMVILPVDQGFEHGPARSFAKNPAGYDPLYHYQLAIDAGCNAYAAPLGFLEAGARTYAGRIPTILKLNNNESLYSSPDPKPAVTGSVEDALRLGCAAIGFTIYPGSAEHNEMYMEFREIAEEAKAAGLAVVLWSYPRGSGISKEGETAIDVVAYAAQIAAQLGAHVIKVKPPTEHIEQDAARKVYEAEGIDIAKLSDRIAHVIQSAFHGRRIVIFSGGAAKGTDALLEEIKGIAEGGGFGSIMGRNSFQRPKTEAIELLHSVMDLYAQQA
jgi:class I fructose-bisphosphate aldolase